MSRWGRRKRSRSTMPNGAVSREKSDVDEVTAPSALRRANLQRSREERVKRDRFEGRVDFSEGRAAARRTETQTLRMRRRRPALHASCRSLLAVVIFLGSRPAFGDTACAIELTPLGA